MLLLLALACAPTLDRACDAIAAAADACPDYASWAACPADVAICDEGADVYSADECEALYPAHEAYAALLVCQAWYRADHCGATGAEVDRACMPELAVWLAKAG